MSTHSDFADRRYPARFSDGQTAASEQASVELTERGLLITRPGTDAPLIWPYGAIAVAEPLTPHAIDALVTYSYQPGASLFVQGPAFARALAEAAPRLTARAERWRHTAPWLWAAAAVAAVIAIVWMADFSPARTIAGWLPQSAREALGRQVMASMTEGRQICEARPGRAALDRLASRLTEATGTSDTFKLTVVDWSLVNAFATPGEHIVLTRALIETSQGPDELAGVIAHEMGHGLERHPETALVRAIGLTAAAELMLGGGGGTLTNLGLVLAQLSYTRSAEREADEHALAILRRAGISAKGLADFFGRLRRLETGGGEAGGSSLGGAADLLRTHPQTAERLDRVRRVVSYPATPAMPAEDWQALKSICQP